MRNYLTSIFSKYYLFRSAEWKKVSDGEKKELGLTFADNGEFWYVLKS